MKTYPTTTTLYFGPWYRRSPFFDGTQRAGCKAYDIYNKMYLPAEYDDPAVEYQALQDGVTLWDVGVERTVQISGPDADRLVDSITCRDLTRCAVKQCKYMLVTAPSGGIVNDPVLVHPEENVWWMQLADSDAGLYAIGVLSQRGAAAATMQEIAAVAEVAPATLYNHFSTKDELLQAVRPVLLSTDPMLPIPSAYDEELTDTCRREAQDYLDDIAERGVAAAELGVRLGETVALLLAPAAPLRQGQQEALRAGSVARLAVPFKRQVYQDVVREFASLVG
jgi:hypothetical protein